MAINLVKVNPEILAEAGERAKEFVKMFSNMIFSSTGEGMGMNAISITFYKNYINYLII